MKTIFYRTIIDITISNRKCNRSKETIRDYQIMKINVKLNDLVILKKVIIFQTAVISSTLQLKSLFSSIIFNPVFWLIYVIIFCPCYVCSLLLAGRIDSRLSYRSLSRIFVFLHRCFFWRSTVFRENSKIVTVLHSSNTFLSAKQKRILITLSFTVFFLKLVRRRANNILECILFLCWRSPPFCENVSPHWSHLWGRRVSISAEIVRIRVMSARFCKYQRNIITYLNEVVSDSLMRSAEWIAFDIFRTGMHIERSRQLNFLDLLIYWFHILQTWTIIDESTI